MTDEPLIAALMAADDTLSRGAAEQAIKIVREHDRREAVERVNECGIGRQRVILPQWDTWTDQLGPNTNMKPGDL